MSTSAEEFGTPNVDATDYYERLGAPQSATADEIDGHTKKYVAQFKPELSDHENADERWDRFNEARQTLSDESEKELYDTFRERFGPEQGAEAYQTWEARDRPKDPARVDPVRDLGIAPESDAGSTTEQQTETAHTSREASTGTGSASARQKTARQTSTTSTGRDDAEASGRTGHRSATGSTDHDLDTSGTHSTRSSATGEQTAQTVEQTGSSVFDRIVSRVRSSSRIAVAETVTALSMFEWFLLAYLAFVAIGDVGASTVSGALFSSGSTVGAVLQDVVAVAVLGGVGYPVLGAYFERFSGGDGRSTPPGRRAVTALDAPERALIVPTLVGLLGALGFVTGGGGFSVLVAGAAVLSVHGRYRVIERVRSLPEWADDVDRVAGGAALVALLTVLVQMEPGATFSRASATAHPLALVVVAIAYAVAILGPGAAVVSSRGE